MARFDHNTYRSLNASINGVQNQPAALDEMAQTPARAKEMGKRIAAERDPKKKAYLKQWDAGEKISNRTYGTKGRIIKAHRPGSHQEAVEYAEFLEGILDTLCEELGLDPQALMEDLQTPEREAESEKNLKKLQRRAGDWSVRLRNQTRGKAARERQAKADAALKSAQDRHYKEQDSKTVYGKGGKPVRKGSEDHKRAMKRKRDMNAKKRADAERHERQKRESEAWHRSKAGDRDHRAQMHGFSDDLHMLGPRVDHENYR